MTKRHNRMAVLGTLGAAVLLSGCVSMGKYDALENEYNQLQAKLAGQNVRVSHLQGAIKVAVNNELLFPSGGWEMSEDAKKLIASIAPILVPIQQTAINVNGYTDNVPVGPELMAKGVQSNQQLSQMRAQNVSDFLVSQGVKPSLLSVHGFGDTDPVAPNDTAEGRAQNRRVELVLAGTGQ